MTSIQTNRSKVIPNHNKATTIENKKVIQHQQIGIYSQMQWQILNWFEPLIQLCFKDEQEAPSYLTLENPQAPSVSSQQGKKEEGKPPLEEL